MPPKKTGRKKKKPKIILPSQVEEKKPQDFGDYKLGNQLGRGAFGAVYQGFDTSNGTFVAIKTIPLNNQNSLSGVQSEIEMMSNLINEHIVKYIGSHKTDDFLYIVMEFAEGGSLQHIQKKFANFNEQLAAQYIHQVLLGLQYLHSQSIIHRDIKAANILLNNNVAKLSDFGISVNLNEGPKADADFQCSPYWAAPEVINMESITEKCDIWSLGITAIEMFTGQPPYFDLSPIPAMFKIVQNQETPLPENISDEFKDFLLGCLNRNVTFRKSTEELLNHNWITRKNLKNDPDLEESSDDGKYYETNMLRSSMQKQNTSNFDQFQESSDGSDMFGSDDDSQLSPMQKKPAAPSADIEKFAESSDDDMDFDGNLNPRNSVALPMIVPGPKALENLDEDDEFEDLKPKKKDNAPKDLDDFVEDEQSDDDDFGAAFTGPGSGLSLQLVPQKAKSKLSPTVPLNPLGSVGGGLDDDDSDDMFGGGNDAGLSFQTNNPRAKIANLDDIFDADEDADQREQERQNQVMKNVIQMMEKLPGLCEDQNNVDNTTIDEQCNTLMKYFNNESSLRTNLTDYHGVIPIVEIIQTRNQYLLEHALPFIIVASSDQTDTQNMLCLLGVLPYFFDYCIMREYSATIQEMSLKILHSFCISKKKPLQMFISAGGLPKMARILEAFPHKERPILTKLVIDIVDSVFSFHCSTPRSCFARIMAQSNLIQLLGKRFVDISKDDPSMKTICGIFEVFSNGDTQVKLKMADSKFIDHIFTKACYQWHARTLKGVPQELKNLPSGQGTIGRLFGKHHNVSKQQQATNNANGSSPQMTPEEVIASTSGLNDFDLLTIMRVMNNLAMDKAVVQVLWNTKLVDNLLEYLKVDRHPQMNPMLNTCFSALFHLSRVLSSENVPKIAPLIPMLVYIITNGLQLKELATTLFLEFINTHSRDKQMRLRLEQSNGIETLFFLLEKNPHKEQIISQFDNWASSQNMAIEKALINHRDKFAEIVESVLKTETTSVQAVVADKLLQICDKCPRFTQKLSETPLIKCIIAKLNSHQIRDYPELRKSFISMVLVFYQSTEKPKKLIVDCRLDTVGRRLMKDPSLPVKNLALQLMQSVSSNYVL